MLAGQNPSLTWNDNGQVISVSVQEGVLSSLPRIEVKLKGSNRAIFGKSNLLDQGFRFIPDVAFSPGLTYDIYVDGKALYQFTIPSGEARTFVSNIYPTADSLPENLLKIYIQFSGAMGENYSEQYLTVTSGEDTVQQVFLPLQPELWDTSHSRLTLWLDPGRTKRDLGPNVLWGAPLQLGKYYTLHIDAHWKDQIGLPLIESYQKSIYVEAADRTHPDCRNWIIHSPTLNTLEPLIIDFREPMDYALLLDCIHVYKQGRKIPVMKSVSNNESILTLVPEKKWKDGLYQVEIASRLEDLAGNNLNRLFDRDLINDKEAPSDQQQYILNFTIQ